MVLRKDSIRATWSRQESSFKESAVRKHQRSASNVAYSDRPCELSLASGDRRYRRAERRPNPAQSQDHSGLLRPEQRDEQDGRRGKRELVRICVVVVQDHWRGPSRSGYAAERAAADYPIADLSGYDSARREPPRGGRRDRNWSF